MNIDEIKIAAQENLARLRQEIEVWDGFLKVIASNTVSHETSDFLLNKANIGLVKDQLNESHKNLPQLERHDYKVDWHIREKTLYYAREINRAFKNSEFQDWLVNIEGQEKANQTTGGNLGSKLKLLGNQGILKIAKFNEANIYTFYLLPEWLTPDKTDIQKDHYPSNESFGNLHVDVRNAEKITWLNK
ncbi:MAG: hypothetical protein V4635_09555 [Bacteroidota bacterium]